MLCSGIPGLGFRKILNSTKIGTQDLKNLSIFMNSSPGVGWGVNRVTTYATSTTFTHTRTLSSSFAGWPEPPDSLTSH